MKHLIRLGLVGAAGWLIWRRLRSEQGGAPAYTLDAVPEAGGVTDDIENAVGTPPHVRERDLVELAFVADALGIDLTPQTPNDDVQRA